MTSDICLSADGEKEDLAWIQVIAISFKLWQESLALCCQSADLEHLKAISFEFGT